MPPFIIRKNIVAILFVSANAFVYAQDSFDCTAAANEPVVYCNDFETRNEVNGTLYEPSSTYYDASDTYIPDAYAGTEVKNLNTTVNGLSEDIPITQQYTVETVRYNNYNFLTNNSGNQYGIGMLAHSGSGTYAADLVGGDLITFSFDIKDVSTNDTASFVEMQIDFAPLFLAMAAYDGERLPPSYRIWGEAPRLKVSLYDGQLTTLEQGSPNPDLTDAAVRSSPPPLSTQIIEGGVPAAATAKFADYPLDFKRSTIRLSTAGASDPNGTVTLMFDLLDDRTNNEPGPLGHYATWDNLKVTAVFANTVVAKSITGQTGNNNAQAEEGETISYQVVISNPSSQFSTEDVNIKDSLLLDLPNGVTATTPIFSDSVSVNNFGDYVIDSIPASGSVTMTYSVTMPTGANFAALDEIINSVTNDGSPPPSTCNTAMSNTCTRLSSKELDVSVTLSGENGSLNNIGEAGETLTFTVSLTNTSSNSANTNVNVRDSLLADLPPGTTLLAEPTLSDGGLTKNADGDYVIDSIDPSETVTLTYSVVLPSEPGFSALDGIASNVTVDGSPPPTDCVPPSSKCAELITKPLIVDAELSNEDGTVANLGEAGETLTYRIAISNPSSTVDSANTPIKDTLLANLPSGAVLSEGPTLSSGNLTTNSLGDYEIDNIAAGETVYLSYNVTLPNEPDFASINGIGGAVTADGSTPATSCNPNTESNCTLLDTKTLNASVDITSESGSIPDFAEAGETLTYQITVNNPSNLNPATNINVKDSLLADLPDGTTLVGNPTFIGSGSLTKNSDGDFSIDNIPAGEDAVITYTIQLPTGEVFAGLEDIVANVSIDGSTPANNCINTNTDNCLLLHSKALSSSIALIGEDGVVPAFAEAAETLTYQISINNLTPTTVLNDVNVIDSLLTNLPTGVSLVGTVQLSSGQLTEPTTGNFVIDNIAANSSITLTYQLLLPTAEAFTNLQDLVTYISVNGSPAHSACSNDNDNCIAVRIYHNNRGLVRGIPTSNFLTLLMLFSILIITHLHRRWHQ